jgi:putative redox protein
MGWGGVNAADICGLLVLTRNLSRFAQLNHSWRLPKQFYEGASSRPHQETAAMPDPLTPVGEEVVVAETGLGRLQVEARTASGALLIDEPVSVGGLGSGPNPYDLLSAALGSCTSMTLRLYAERKGWPLGRVRVSVLHHRASLDSRDIFELAIALEGPLDEAQKARLMEIAEHCPVHRTLDRGSEVKATLSGFVAAAPSLAAPPEHMRDAQAASAE